MGAINKAVAALISNAVLLFGVFGMAIEVTPEMVAAISTVVTTIIVYLVPNIE